MSAIHSLRRPRPVFAEENPSAPEQEPFEETAERVSAYALPEKMVPCSPNSGCVHLTPESKKATGVVYAFWDSVNDTFYVGQTVQLARRVSCHNSNIRHEEKIRGQAALYDRIRSDPSTVFFGILKMGISPSLLRQLEKEEIAEHDAYTHGYCGNAGSEERTTLNDSNTENINPHVTPEKYYPVRTRANGGIYFDLTPRAANAKGVVYVIRDQETGARYIGQTVRELKRRLAEHAHYANHPEKAEANPEFYKALHEHPENFQVGILHCCQGRLDEIEALLIDSKDAHASAGGFNHTRGNRKSVQRNLTPLLDADRVEPPAKRQKN